MDVIDVPWFETDYEEKHFWCEFFLIEEGYTLCECCKCWYKNLNQHYKTKKHRKNLIKQQ
jgi:hypothetical protein